MLQLRHKIRSITTETRGSQINKYIYIYFVREVMRHQHKSPNNLLLSFTPTLGWVEWPLEHMGSILEGLTEGKVTFK